MEGQQSAALNWPGFALHSRGATVRTKRDVQTTIRIYGNQVRQQDLAGDFNSRDAAFTTAIILIDVFYSRGNICSGDVVRKATVRIFVLSILLATAITPARANARPRVTAAGASATPQVIVVGFLGGFVKHDNLVHSEVQLAARLRKEYPADVDVETFESYRGEKARRKILQLLDTDHDGTLSAEEKQGAKIILYGHSWGASESITLARQLKKDGVPVLLTIQVDSVSKIGQNDVVIPTNVAQAANFYQPSGILHGKREIRPADPARTRIIGNFQFDYRASRYSCNEYPWFDRLLAKRHTQMECDPKVWDQVESLIRSNIILTGSPAEFRANK